MSQKVTHHTSRGIDAIIGASDWARSIRAEIVRVAEHDSSVLITGPSGTGKELVARAICTHSHRRDGPIVPVDCAALPSDLFVSQMFGHLKGAFTGAHCSTMGAFRAADGGTIFLDEIGELDPPVQAKLLRVIQERTVVPLGSHQGEAIDVRIIAATNRNLEDEVRAGRFREDLFYRLNVISLKMLPLAQRLEDIEHLSNHFLHRLAIDAGLPLKRLSASGLNLLCSYSWPGNVRELNNHLERAVIHTSGDVLGPESMPELVEAVTAANPACGQPPRTHPSRQDCSTMEQAGAHAPCQQNSSDEESKLSGDIAGGARNWPTMAEIERQHIQQTLEKTFFNQCEAAKMLGIDRHALRRRIKKLGLDTSRSRRGRPTMNPAFCDHEGLSRSASWRPN